MAYSSNSEPRRFWRARGSRDRSRCVGCGGRANTSSSDLPFCTGCMDWARQSKLTEWDELGAGD